MTEPATEHQIYTISNEVYTLKVLADLGASILNLHAASGRPVMRPVSLSEVKTSSQCASFSLLPYSNRIRDAHFQFAGQDIVLRANTKDGLAQHGDVRNRPWQVRQLSDTHLVCDFNSRDFADMNWPWAFTARLEYILTGPHFDTVVSLTNVDTTDMPAGLGLHPYFQRLQANTSGELIDPKLSFDAPLTYDTDERMLPTGAPRPVGPEENYCQPAEVGQRQIDRGYAGWQGAAELDWGERRLSIQADPVYTHLIVYTAPDGSLALEPVTHATDAFNLAAQGLKQTGMQTLAPQQTLSGTARITLSGDW